MAHIMGRHFQNLGKPITAQLYPRAVVQFLFGSVMVFLVRDYNVPPKKELLRRVWEGVHTLLLERPMDPVATLACSPHSFLKRSYGSL